MGQKLLARVFLVSSLVIICLSQVALGQPAPEWWTNTASSGTWHSNAWAFSANGSASPASPWTDGNSAIFSATNANQTGNYTVTLDSNATVQDLTYTGGNSGSVFQIAVAAGSTIRASTSVMNVTVNNGTTMVIAPAIVETTSTRLVVMDPGTLILTGANTYSGGTTITVGATLSVSSDLNLGAPGGSIALTGGELRTTGNFITARTITLDLFGFINELAAQGGTSAIYQGVISGSGGLQIGDGGFGKVIFQANNTYVGDTTVFLNTVLSIDRDAELGNISNGIKLLNGGELLTSANFATARSVFLNPPIVLPTIGIVTPLGEAFVPNILAAAANTTASYTGLVFGTGGLGVGDLKGNSGTVILTDAANSYTGGTVIQGGATLSVASDSMLGDSRVD